MKKQTKTKSKASKKSKSWRIKGKSKQVVIPGSANTPDSFLTTEELSKYTLIGVDPGRNPWLFHSTSRDLSASQQPKKPRQYKLTKKQWQCYTGNTKRRLRREALVRRNRDVQLAQRDKTRFPRNVGSLLGLLRHAVVNIKHSKTLTEFYSRSVFRNHQYSAQLQKKEALKRVAKEICEAHGVVVNEDVNNLENVVILWGDYSKKSHQTLQFARYLKKCGAKVYFTSELYTSQRCCHCNSKLNPHPFPGKRTSKNCLRCSLKQTFQLNLSSTMDENNEKIMPQEITNKFGKKKYARFLKHSPDSDVAKFVSETVSKEDVENAKFTARMRRIFNNKLESHEKNLNLRLNYEFYRSSPSDNHLQVTVSCGVIWNRDYNSGATMFQLGLRDLLGLTRPPCFTHKGN